MNHKRIRSDDRNEYSLNCSSSVELRYLSLTCCARCMHFPTDLWHSCIYCSLVFADFCQRCTWHVDSGPCCPGDLLPFTSVCTIFLPFHPQYFVSATGKMSEAGQVIGVSGTERSDSRDRKVGDASKCLSWNMESDRSNMVFESISLLLDIRVDSGGFQCTTQDRNGELWNFLFAFKILLCYMVVWADIVLPVDSYFDECSWPWNLKLETWIAPNNPKWCTEVNGCWYSMPDSTVMCRDQRTVTICFAQVTVKLRLFISIVTIVVSTSAIVLKAVLHISLVSPHTPVSRCSNLLSYAWPVNQ